MGIRVLCPAKINLFLSVGPQNDAGYHPIRTVFQAVSLCDELEIEESDHDRVESDWPEMPEDNTVTVALRRVRELVEMPPLHVRIIKRIPSQAGMGGGSSDAAGLLRAVSHFSKFPAPALELLEVARSVGADVPFFMVGGLAQGEGYGEALTPLEDPQPCHVVVAKPSAGVSTREAYARLDQLPRRLADWPKDHLGGNDFESVASPECLSLKRALADLGAFHALLCGSGSAVYGLFHTDQEAEQAHKAVTKLAGVRQAWTCKTLGRQGSLAIGPTGF